MDLYEQAAEELAEGSVTIGRVAVLEAWLADLEGQGRRLEAGKALRKEKRGMKSTLYLAESFLHFFCP